MSTETDTERAAAAHRALVEALHDPACYPHAIEGVRLIETHISSVLLTGPYAYKLKKPVDTGFLDYTTLAARRHFCLEELRLNARLAPDLYLEVVPIGGSPAAPRVGAAEGVLDYAVKMVEFPQEALLDRLIAAGTLGPQRVDMLAAKVADFHARAAVGGAADARGSPEHVAAPVRRCLASLRSLAGPDDRPRIDALAGWTEARHAALGELVSARREQGRIRECHGDLHLGNVALVGGALEIFDCIEFDPELRWIDVLSEVAFLAMDFAARGRPDFAARFANAWLEITGDYAGVPLLPYYLVYRAAVRAMVAKLRAGQSSDGSAARREAEDDYARRLALAEAFAAPRHPALVLTHGVSGSGKTSVSQAVLEALGALRLRSDVERKRLHGLVAGARSDAGLRPALYGEAATAATYAALAGHARTLLGAGFDTIVDATFLRRRQRDAFRALAVELGVPFLILHCHADVATLRERVVRRAAAGVDASEADLGVLEAQLGFAEPLSEAEARDALDIDTTAADAPRVVAQVRMRLRGN